MGGLFAGQGARGEVTDAGTGETVEESAIGKPASRLPKDATRAVESPLSKGYNARGSPGLTATGARSVKHLYTQTLRPLV